jgi:hypothetical protein
MATLTKNVTDDVIMLTRQDAIRIDKKRPERGERVLLSTNIDIVMRFQEHNLQYRLHDGPTASEAAYILESVTPAFEQHIATRSTDNFVFAASNSFPGVQSQPFRSSPRCYTMNPPRFDAFIESEAETMRHTTQFESITARPGLRHASFEELRLDHYAGVDCPTTFLQLSVVPKRSAKETGASITDRSSNGKAPVGKRRLTEEYISSVICRLCFEKVPQLDTRQMSSCCHIYCHNCLKMLFDLSLNGTLHFPPTCCMEIIPFEYVRQLFNSDFENRFVEKEEKKEHEGEQKTIEASKTNDMQAEDGGREDVLVSAMKVEEKEYAEPPSGLIITPMSFPVSKCAVSAHATFPSSVTPCGFAARSYQDNSESKEQTRKSAKQLCDHPCWYETYDDVDYCELGCGSTPDPFWYIMTCNECGMKACRACTG